MHVADHTANSQIILQVKLFTEAWTDKVPFFPLLRASTKAEAEEAKEKLIDGMKARVLHVCTAATSEVNRPLADAWTL
jgi:hypothetical protein